MTKKVFISYDYDNDKHYKNLLVAWSKNSDFDISFQDLSADVSINSTDAAVIKRAISAKINNSSYLLCIVGEKTHSSKWVEWEIGTAILNKKKLIAVKIDKSYTTPAQLLNCGAKWALSFTFDSIKKAFE